MAERSLAQRVLDLPSFQRELTKATLISITEQFSALTPEPQIIENGIDLNYALECASIVGRSDRGDCQDAALRVAHFVLSRNDATDGQRAAAAIVLEMLTNRSALDLAVRRQLVPEDFRDRISSPLLLDSLRREVEFSIMDATSGSLAMLNRFQLDVYRKVGDLQWVSISAPTSSGKSFILERAACDAIAAGEARHVVYIVPTRALVQEVELDFRALLAALLPKPVVTSVPRWPMHDGTPPPMVFVFTQERLHLLLGDNPAFQPDLLIVDEAQKIGEGSRGILLERVLDDVTMRSPKVRIIFASPMASNPAVLLEGAPSSATTAIVSSEHVAVNQNLLWVSQVSGKPTRWTMELCQPNQTIPLGSFELPYKPSPDSKRLPFVAAVLGQGGGNLVYVKGAAEAENISRLLADYFREQASDDAELDALTDLVRRTIHEKYALVETIQCGVAFHYGNMPLLIRSEIERLFRTGKLKYLVCTSTLIEGVNLPAKSIFIRGPRRGIGKPMNDVDFWNLAGRAGRQGKEFQGNIVCVDPRNSGVWKVLPPRSRQLYAIERSTSRVIGKRGDELVQYIDDGTPRSTSRDTDELESTFVYLSNERLRWGGLSRSPKMSAADHATVARLERACAIAGASVELPSDVLLRHPGVSPLAQQRLLDHFRGSNDVSKSIPADPASEDAVDSYLHVIGTASRYLSGDPLQLTFPRAILVVHWMRGYALARLIAEAWKYWRPRGRSLAGVIRHTMSEIEEYARFRFAKYSSCYADVLRFHLREMNREDLIADIPRLDIWLEFGTSIVTQVSLISLGLSRTSAIELSTLIADDNLEMDAVLQRLGDMPLEGTNLSPIIVNEVRRVLGIRSSA